MKEDILYKPGDLVKIKDGCHPIVYPKAHKMMTSPFMVLKVETKGEAFSIRAVYIKAVYIKIMSVLEPKPGEFARIWEDDLEMAR